MEDLGLKCNYCQQKGSNLRRCSRCLNVYYCSKACQSMEWLTHRQVCQKPSRTKIRTDLEFGEQASTYAAGEYKAAGERTDETKDSETKARNETKPRLNERESQTTDRQSPVVKKKTDDNNMGAEKPADESADLEPQSQCGSSRPTGVTCKHCGVLGCEKRCSRCQKAVYCSRRCQQQDWSMHKKVCKKKMSEEDERILKSYLKMKDSDESFHASEAEIAKKYPFRTAIQNYMGPRSRIFQMLTLEQAMIHATRPDGSLQAAVRNAKQDFPGFKIVTKFSDVPDEDFVFFMPFVSPRPQYILVAFMYRYHEHAMRHGVYLKDDVDSESKVEFYLDEYFDSPLPFFSYRQVIPGGYICLIKPVMHVFDDGTVGIRVNHPHEAVILDV